MLKLIAQSTGRLLIPRQPSSHWHASLFFFTFFLSFHPFLFPPPTIHTFPPVACTYRRTSLRSFSFLAIVVARRRKHLSLTRYVSATVRTGIMPWVSQDQTAFQCWFRSTSSSQSQAAAHLRWAPTLASLCQLWHQIRPHVITSTSFAVLPANSLVLLVAQLRELRIPFYSTISSQLGPATLATKFCF